MLRRIDIQSIIALCALTFCVPSAVAFEGQDFVPSVFLTRLGGATPVNSILRFVNEGRSAGTVTLTLYDAATGTQLATWTSVSIPSGAGLQATMAQVIGASTPSLSTSEQTALLNGALTATFPGTVQQLTIGTSDIVDQTQCGSDRILGYVEGPAFPNVTGAIALSNNGSTTGTITLRISDASTGTELGAWTSASVPAHGTVTVTSAAIAAAATPVVPSTTAALNIVPTKATARLQVEHVAVLAGQTIASNLTASCPLHE